VRTNLFVPSQIWTPDAKFDTNSLSALYSDMRKKIYIGAFLLSFSALNYGSGILFKSNSYLYEVVHTNFSIDFWTIRNF